MAIDHNEPADGETRHRAATDIERGDGSGPEGSSSQNADKAAEALEPHPSHPTHPDREDERLDEGLEETFPASDPVSAKHIT